MREVVCNTILSYDGRYFSLYGNWKKLEFYDPDILFFGDAL